MTDNTALWDKLGKTDPAHTKSFKRSGGFTGTAIKPMWSYRRMTEEFGPCGIGWGINNPNFQVVPGSNGEVLVYCTVSIWYNCDKLTETSFKDTISEVYGVGGDKVVTYIKANEQFKRPERWENDDEAFKKAYTDAVTNALKMIGVGADVHMGMFDDNKYVNTVAKEFEAEKKPKADRTLLDSLLKSMRQNRNAADLRGWWSDNECKEQRNKLPDDQYAELKAAFETYGKSFQGSTGIHDASGRELHNSEA